MKFSYCEIFLFYIICYHSDDLNLSEHLRGLAPFAHEQSLLSISSILFKMEVHVDVVAFESNVKLKTMGHTKATCIVISNSNRGKYWELNSLKVVLCLSDTSSM